MRIMKGIENWLREERAMHVTAIARIDARLAALAPTPEVLPVKTPAACVAILKAAAPKPMRVVDVLDALTAQGRTVTNWAVYQGLRRLAIMAREVERVEGGYRWKGGDQ